jgi:hypothetical protein
MVKENLLLNPDLLYALLFFKAFLSSPVPLPSKLLRIRTANLSTAQPESYSLRAQKDYFWQASGCIGVLSKEILPEASDIHEEHVRGKPVGRRALTRGHVIVSILHQKLVDGLCHEMVTEVDPDIHPLFPF